jgi:hypothetical protein
MIAFHSLDRIPLFIKVEIAINPTTNPVPRSDKSHLQKSALEKKLAKQKLGVQHATSSISHAKAN